MALFIQTIKSNWKKIRFKKCFLMFPENKKKFSARIAINMIFTKKEIRCLKTDSRFEIYDKFSQRSTKNKKSIKIKIFGWCVPLIYLSFELVKIVSSISLSHLSIGNIDVKKIAILAIW